jgi:hypothetical protein
VRTVLAYQRQNAATAEAPAAAEAWDPGSLTDEELARHFKPAVLSRAREQFQRGLLLELVRSYKPSVRFHDLACTLRFQVPNDIRYVHCDCAQEPPCQHVPLAVWGFRRLPAHEKAGIFTTHEQKLPVPSTLLDQVEAALLELLAHGLSGTPTSWRDQLARLEAQCRSEGLVWPAEVLVELIQQYERYTAHDARFAPDRCAELVGEMVIRVDAIRYDQGAVPSAWVRGTTADHVTELGVARLIGLGCGVRPGRRAVELVAYLQDMDSGSLVTVRREFADPAPDAKEAPKDFWQLAQTPAVKGAPFSALGAGQLLLQGGKRTPDHQLAIGRARATVNPQGFAWEKLRAPVLTEDFAEVRARLGALPPASLLPRRLADSFHVCAVARARQVVFNQQAQAVQALIEDGHAEPALLQHPYLSRGSDGAERLLDRLAAQPDALRFVAGPVALSAAGLVITPVALVFQEDPGRAMLQPWVDRAQQKAATHRTAATGDVTDSPLKQFFQECSGAIGELLLVGLRRADPQTIRRWTDLTTRGEAIGLVRLPAFIGQVAEGLTQKTHMRHWSGEDTAQKLLRLAGFVRLAAELG